MDKLSTRKALVQARLDMPDRLQRADLLQRVMRIWLVGSPHEVIGAYWPIKGEFDPLDRKSTRLNSSHIQKSRMPSSA